MNHSFNIEIAKKYGIEAAIILENIAHWTHVNIANGHNLHDGRYWIFNSRRAWHVLFPYIPERTIGNVLDRLVKAGILKTGNYNKLPFDRTKWYCFADDVLLDRYFKLDTNDYKNGIGQNGQSTLQEQPKRLEKMANDIGQNGQTIPVIITDINTNINNSNKQPKKTQAKKSKELSVTSVPGLTEIKKIYSDRISAHGITVLNEKVDFIQFTNTFKKLIKTHTQEQITEYVTRWIDEGIGAWCGYKLRNFAGDIGKLTNTVKKQSQVFQTAAEKQSEIIARIMREGEENDRNSMQNNNHGSLYQQKQII